MRFQRLGQASPAFHASRPWAIVLPLLASSGDPAWAEASAPASLSFSRFLAQADGVSCFVLGVLLVMSLVSWYILLAKGWQWLEEESRRRRFLESFLGALDRFAPEQLEQSPAGDRPCTASRVLAAGLEARRQLRRMVLQGPRPGAASEGNGGLRVSAPDEFLLRSLRRAIARERQRLESGLAFLAAVASTSPFVGLFGTVWGIHHALMRIGMTGQGSLDKVAGPVGEALIMTGVGLAVAIPAVLGYNLYVRLNRVILDELDGLAHDVYGLLCAAPGSAGEVSSRPAPGSETWAPALAGGRA